MKNLIKSIKLTLVFCVFLFVCYVLVLWAYAQFAAPGEGGNFSLRFRQQCRGVA